jgi:hypothetical protein
VPLLPPRAAGFLGGPVRPFDTNGFPSR